MIAADPEIARLVGPVVEDDLQIRELGDPFPGNGEDTRDLVERGSVVEHRARRAAVPFRRIAPAPALVNDV